MCDYNHTQKQQRTWHDADIHGFLTKTSAALRLHPGTWKSTNIQQSVPKYQRSLHLS